ncbi:hypothetical protein CCP1ISM_650002 [Azospirillaceae bacterium]
MTAAAADIEIFASRMEAAGFSHDQAAVLAALLAEEQARVLAERPATRRDIDELQSSTRQGLESLRAGSNGADLTGVEGRLDRLEAVFGGGLQKLEEELRGQLARIETGVKAESVRLEVEVRQSESRLEARIARIRGGVVGWVFFLLLLENALLAGAAWRLGLWHL